MTLDLFEERPDIWRGGLTPPENRKTTATGFGQLDKKLSGEGWPAGAITEILCGDDGTPPLWLIMPALAAMSRQPAWITWVAPPFMPYAPALHAIGIELSRIMLVHARARTRETSETPASSYLNSELSRIPENCRIKPRYSRNKDCENFSDICWALEQALKSGTASAVLGWLNNDNPRVLRRLQIAAETGGTTGFIFRPRRYAAQQSNAALRLYVDLHPLGLVVKVLKCRGRWTNSDEPIRILFDQLPTYPVNNQSLEKNKTKSSSMDADHGASPDQQYSIRHYNDPQPYIAKKPDRQLALDINNTSRSINRQTIDGEKIIETVHKNIKKNTQNNRANSKTNSRTHTRANAPTAGRPECDNALLENKPATEQTPDALLSDNRKAPQQLSNGLDTILDLFSSHKT